MPAPQTLDPRAQAAIDFLRAFDKEWVGPILLKNLPAALPPDGERHSWKDAVAVFLLCELIGVYRVRKGNNPFWRGLLYRVDRDDLAKRFACDPDDISSALMWLVALGLVERIRRTPTDAEGKPCGTIIFVVPRMARIKMLLDFFRENGRSMTASELMDSNRFQAGLKSPSAGAELPLKAGSTPAERGAYLNCGKPQQMSDAEGGGETSAQQGLDTPDHDRGSLAANEGGGEADADERTQMPRPSRPPAPPAHRTATTPSANHPAPDTLPSKPLVQGTAGANGHPSAAPPARWMPPPRIKGVRIVDKDGKVAWCWGALFCDLWEQAIVRSGHVSCCTATACDKRAAFKFFMDHPESGPHYPVAVAVNAWDAGQKPKPAGWDGLYLCRASNELGSFLRALASGKLESEIGRLRWKINAWPDLRQWFTQSELTFYRWSEPPVMGIPADDLWEHDPDAPDYYRSRNLVLPPEVAVAEKLREQENHHSSKQV